MRLRQSPQHARIVFLARECPRGEGLFEISRCFIQPFFILAGTHGCSRKTIERAAEGFRRGADRCFRVGFLEVLC